MTAVEWLIQQLVELDKQLDGRRKNDDATVIKLNPTKLYRQAKQMEKEQIKKLLEIIIWYDEESDVRPDAEIYNWFKQYYNETYVNKGSDEHIVETNETINSQTEISDEEIEKESCRMHGVTSIAFEEGAKWYREKLKNK